jgi:hypothetical protein
MAQVALQHQINEQSQGMLGGGFNNAMFFIIKDTNSP